MLQRMTSHSCAAGMSHWGRIAGWVLFGAVTGLGTAWLGGWFGSEGMDASQRPASYGFPTTSRVPDMGSGGALPAADFYAMADAGTWLGPQDAPLVLMVYSSYSCGFARDFHETLTTIRVRYPEHVAVVIKHFGDPASRLPSESQVPLGAECARELGAFDSFHTHAFQAQELVNHSNAAAALAELTGIADLPAFNSCVRSRRHADRLLADWSEAARLGVTGTPTWFLNGQRFEGAHSLEQVDALIAMWLRGT